MEISPDITTLSEGRSIQKTSWDATERWDTKIHYREHPHKDGMDIQPGKKLMGRVGSCWMERIHLEIGINFSTDTNKIQNPHKSTSARLVD